MDKTFKRHVLGVGEFLSGIAESEQTPNSDDICAAGFEIFECSPHIRASIDHIIQDCDAFPLHNVAERVGNAIACREKVRFIHFTEAFPIREGHVQFRGYDQCDKSSLYDCTGNIAGESPVRPMLSRSDIDKLAYAFGESAVRPIRSDPPKPMGSKRNREFAGQP